MTPTNTMANLAFQILVASLKKSLAHPHFARSVMLKWQKN